MLDERAAGVVACAAVACRPSPRRVPGVLGVGLLVVVSALFPTPPTTMHTARRSHQLTRAQSSLRPVFLASQLARWSKQRN